jgi:hypothetical protein
MPDPFADGPGDDSTFELSIPNDASELAAEIAAYQKELRARRRKQRVDRLTLARYWRPYGLTGPIVITVLVVIGSVSGLLLALLPTANSNRHIEPVATTKQSVGSIGGVLPNDLVDVNGTQKSVQALRPSLLALVPANCRCASVINHIAGQAREYDVPMYVVSGLMADPQLTALTRTAAGTVEPVIDPGYVLRDLYAGPADRQGVTVVLVRGDAVVTHVLHQVDETTVLRGVLVLLDQAAT